MKRFIFLFLLIPLTVWAIDRDSSNFCFNDSEFTKIKNESMQNQQSLSNIEARLDVQEKLYEKTINCISTQLDVASYGITIFGFLFAIVAIVLGVYITRIERRVIHIKEESSELLRKTIKNKEEVVEINNLIQKDIYGLYLKMKREETLYLLKRLLLVPKDITNIIEQLLSRELEKGDFNILKEAYLNLMKMPKEQRGRYGIGTSYENSYKLLFFQHFLDLSMEDQVIGNDLIDFYPDAIQCAFENDIVKSTQDFMRVLMNSGYKTKEKEINSYIRGLSKSNYKNTDSIYKIIFNCLENRENQFGLFSLISNDNDCRIGKANYGKFLISAYSAQNLNDTEKAIIDQTNAILAELDQEKQKDGQ